MTTHICVAPSSVSAGFSLEPEDASSSRRFMRLPHPRTGLPSLFLATTSDASSSTQTASSILEVQAVAPDANRSWFMNDDTIISDGKLLLFTPMDPIFLILPIFLALGESSVSKFRPLEDIFEDASERLVQRHDERIKEGEALDKITPSDILYLSGLDCVRQAARKICEYKDVADEITVYRYMPPKLLEVLRAKVARLSEAAAFDSFRALTRSLAKDGLALQLGPEKEPLRQEARTRASCEVLSHYLPPAVYKTLRASYDFAAFTTHLENITAEEKAANSGAVAAHQHIEEYVPKDAKKKAKATSSRGVQQLAKANTQGMAKLNTFFTKKEKAK